MKKFFILPLIAAFLFFGFTKENDRPKLVVFIVCDQATPEILKKYDHLFTGGFRWLIDHGIQFDQTYHEHGNTVTGPGHFALSSGLYPGNGGLIGNRWFDRNIGRSWYCVEDTSSIELSDSSTGRSYRYINNTTLGDWLKTSIPNSKVVSISGKDRSAVLLGGKNPEISLWYDKNGGWTSSTYYTEKLPEWVSAFNKEIDVASYLDSTWDRFASEDIYLSNTRKDNFYGESDWSMKSGYSPTFPIKISELGLDNLNSIYHTTPYGDNTLLKLGMKAVVKYDMGIDNESDILFLGLSAADGVGHSFGPHSHEQLDNFIRLDKNLGEFISALEKRIGKDEILYVFTSDHGVLGLPEYLKSKGIDAGRIPKPTRDALFTLALETIDKEVGPNKVNFYGNSFYFNTNMGYFEKRKATKILKSILIKIPGIESISSKSELLKGGNSNIDIRLKNMVHSKKSPDIYLIPKKYWTWSYPSGTSHGSPYDYDSHIPFIIANGRREGSISTQKVKSVDIAPTIAKSLNISFPSNLDGEPILFK